MQKRVSIRTIIINIMLISIFVTIACVNVSPSYADGFVPKSTPDSFPLLDARLIGMPIKKTELATALISYSKAEAELSALTKNQNSLLDQSVVLQPELIVATDNLAARKLQLSNIQNSLNSIVISQYQKSSGAYKESNENIVDVQRRASQADQVLFYLKKKMDKTKKRVDDANSYKVKIDNKVTEINNILKTISADMLAKQKEVNSTKSIVGSVLPVASLDGFDIPVLTMDSYLRAEKTIAQNNPTCAIPWWLIAGIGRAESNHGRFGGAVISANGTVTPSIIGVPLNGQGFAAIRDTDKGLYDGDTEWDRAVGVMQFIPGTWNRWKGDGNGDGLFDPQNLYDGALATAQYLCSSAPNLTNDEYRRQAVYAYNHSNSYVDFVLAKGHEYELLGAPRLNPMPIVAAPVIENVAP